MNPRCNNKLFTEICAVFFFDFYSFYCVMEKLHDFFFSLEKINIVGPDYSTFACPLISRLCYNLISVCDDLFSTCGGFPCFQDENQCEVILYLFFFYSLQLSAHILASLWQGKSQYFHLLTAVLASEEFLFPTWDSLCERTVSRKALAPNRRMRPFIWQS